MIVVALLAMGGAATAAGPSGASSAYSPDKPVVAKRGDRGAAVKRIQRRLRVRPVDGVFGRITERAVRRFQRRNGLTADGVVGAATRAAMGLAPARSASDGDAPAIRLPRVLRRIAECESGGNPAIVSPDGRYRGKYQFTRSTWRALGGSGDPAAASEGTQDRLALKLYRRSGTTPWPACA